MRLRRPSETFSATFLALLFAGGLHAAAAQPAFQVKDINTSRTGSAGRWPFRGDLVRLGSEVLFSADDGIHGTEPWITDGTEAGTRLVADVCPGVCSSAPAGLTATASGSRAFFSADDGVHGAELWVTDGTPQGTALAADLVPGLAASDPFYLAAFGETVAFSAADPVHGPELWISDGTAAGTVRLTDLSPLSDYSRPVPWTELGGRLIFIAEDAGSGKELWTTDGTPAGTHLLNDIQPGGGSSIPALQEPHPGAMPFAVLGGRLFFAADDGTNGYELWASDGTAAGTVLVADIWPGPGYASAPAGFSVFAGSVYFSAAGAGVGQELWKSDGTAAGTVLVKDVSPGEFASSSPRELTPVGSVLFFFAQDADHGMELWKSDGTEAGTVLVKDLRPGPLSGAFFSGLTLTALGDRLVFYADDGVQGAEPWVSDGTAAGTLPLGDLNPGPNGSLFLAIANADRRAVAGGRWYFRAYTTLDVPILDIWTTDGTPAGTHVLKPINAVTSAFEPLPVHGQRMPGPMADLGGTLVFQASDGIASDLWKTDGTAAGTAALADILSGPAAGLPQDLTPLGGSVLFQATDAAHGAELWSSDGTAAGTGLLADLSVPPGAPGPQGPSSVSYPSELTRLGGLVVFSAAEWLWKSDGADGGTQYLGMPLVPSGPALALSVDDTYVGPQGLERLGGIVLFRAFGSSGAELWKTDGTDPETVLVKDIAAGFGNSWPDQITAAGGLAFFSADDGVAGRELWKTDGTGPGTVLVKDVRPGPGGSMRLTWDAPGQPEDRFAALGGTVFFPADDGVSGEELWKSDGTAAGTVLVRDIFAGAGSSDVRWLTAAGGRIFFVADDGVHGRELWVSDGTPAGTRLLDLFPGPGSSVPQDLFALGHMLLFSATDGVHGRELWRSNGVAVGTRQVQEIAPGPLPASPMHFTPSAANVYFYANDGVTGFELWAAPQADLLTTFTDVPQGYWAWPFVEALAAGGLTGGCSAAGFCPSQPVTRAEIAVFLGRGLHGIDFVPPPATGTRFQDVSSGFWAAPWIEQIALDGVTAGCSVSPPLYCPAAQVSRAEAAVFLLRARYGPAYTPPPATGTRFQDVPAGYWAAPWIEQIAAEGITTGCSATDYCPGQPVSREQMAVFLVRTFNLTLP